MREASRCIGKNNGISAGKQTIKRLFTPILALLIALALLSSSVFAIKQLISLQGKVDFNGVLVDNGNLTVSIHDSAAGGAQLYIDYFNNTIQDGFFDVMLGNGTTLDLNLSQTYYMDLSINGTDLDFDGNERKIFQSPVGYKLSGAENFTVDTNVLFVDSLNDRVGIGTTGPTSGYRLDVVSVGGTGIRIGDTSNVSSLRFQWADATSTITAAKDGSVATAINFNTQTAAGATTGTLSLNAGNVGIGTTGPGYKLDVVTDIADWGMRIFNDGNNANRQGLKITVGTDDNSGTNYHVNFEDGDETDLGYISSSGGTVTYGAFTANHDVSVPEEFNVSGYPYGTLMCIKSLNIINQRGIQYNVEACNQVYAKNVLGAYAGKYQDKPNLHQVYVLGDGHVLVNGESGNIKTGDPITTSSTPGIGMKATSSGMVIGIAQENYDFAGNEVKLIAVQYGVRHYTSDSETQQLRMENEELKQRLMKLEAKVK